MTIRMTPPNKRVGAFVRIRGERHEVVEADANGRKTFLHVTLGKKFSMSRSDQKVLEDAGDLTSDEDYERLLPEIQVALDTDWDCFTSHERDSAMRKQYFMQAMDALPARDRRDTKTLEGLAQQVRDERDPEGVAPSVRSLKRWHFRWVTAGKDPRALADMNWKKGNRREADEYSWADQIICAHIEKYMMHAPYASAAFTAKLADKAILLKADSEGLPLRKRVNQNKRAVGAHRIYDLLENYGFYERLINKFGRKEARIRGRAVTLGPQGDYALHEVEVDHTQLDLMVLDSNGKPRRPWLTVLIDRYSRIILGYFITFDPPSWVSVMMAMRMAVMPKAAMLAELDYDFTYEWNCHGTPDNLFMDRGSEFLSFSLRATAERLKIRLIDLPRASGYLKGKVERWFNVHNQGLIHALPGYTGANPTRRMKESVKAKLTLPELQILVTAFIVDVYNQTPHGTTKAVPAKRFSESFETALHHKYPPSPGLLGPATLHAQTAVLQRSGIRFENMRYQSDELFALWNRRGGNCEVIVRRDMADANRILVYDGSHKPWVLGYLVGKYAGGKWTVVDLEAQIDEEIRIPVLTPEERLKAAQAVARFAEQVKGARNQVKDDDEFLEHVPPQSAATKVTPGRYDPEGSAGGLKPFDIDLPGKPVTHGVEGPFASPSLVSQALDILEDEKPDGRQAEGDLDKWTGDADAASPIIDMSYVSIGISEGDTPPEDEIPRTLVQSAKREARKKKSERGVEDAPAPSEPVPAPADSTRSSPAHEPPAGVPEPSSSPAQLADDQTESDAERPAFARSRNRPV